ncbi:hypothetical protein Fot_38259 [Forsythia ovata]|uniref:Uncharacterized protein n=1 Tax=Forsythia ovata TaxID=205694 RepID=A0ABD1S1C0_9LAMI
MGVPPTVSLLVEATMGFFSALPPEGHPPPSENVQRSNEGKGIFNDEEKAAMPKRRMEDDSSISGLIRTNWTQLFWKYYPFLCCNGSLSAQVLDLCFCEGSGQRKTDRVVKISKDVYLPKPRTQQ